MLSSSSESWHRPRLPAANGGAQPFPLDLHGDSGGFETRTELFKAQAEPDGGCFDNGTPQVKSLEKFFFCPKMRGSGNQTGS